MIEISGLTKVYGTIKAIDQVTFNVEKGQIVGFLGANGAGKTTTMDIICGCSGADEGAVKICGYDITESPIDAKKKLGYLPDVPPLYTDMRVSEAIDYVARLNKVPSKDIQARCDSVMDKLELGDVRSRLVGNLSKGYRQRVAFAQALIHDPEVLVLDEPTEGLDPNQIVHIREMIKALKGNHTVILSSHILSEVQNICDKIVIIDKGKVVQQGSYEELVTALESGHIYQLRVANDPSGVVEKLSKMANIQTPRKLEDQNLVVEFAVASNQSDDILDEIAKEVINGGHGLRELTLKTKSLEDVFFSLTH